MKKIVLSGNMISLDINEIDSHLTVDSGVDADMEAGDLETAHIMAMEEMEDEYDELLPETLMFRKYG